MREIKFRAWDKLDKEMFSVVIIDPRMSDVIKVGFLQNPSWGIIHRRSEQLELMQSTGLHDKNGNEIWEGDIVENERFEIGIIKFNNGAFVSEYIPPYNWDSMELVDGLLNRQKVIGNIYKNPELLIKKV